MVLLKTIVGRVLVMVKTHTVDSWAVLFYLAAVRSNESPLLRERLASSQVVSSSWLCADWTQEPNA